MAYERRQKHKGRTEKTQRVVCACVWQPLLTGSNFNIIVDTPLINEYP